MEFQIVAILPDQRNSWVAAKRTFRPENFGQMQISLEIAAQANKCEGLVKTPL
jgi:hypothetical protein